MNISNKPDAQVPYQKVIQCKQRLLAMTELFDADLVVCLTRHAQAWTVVALEGKLAGDERRGRLPDHTLERTLDLGRGVTMAEALGDPSARGRLDFLVVSTISAVMNEGRLVFLAAKLAKKGVYQEKDIRALASYLAAFEEAGV